MHRFHPHCMPWDSSPIYPSSTRWHSVGSSTSIVLYQSNVSYGFSSCSFATLLICTVNCRVLARLNFGLRYFSCPESYPYWNFELLKKSTRFGWTDSCWSLGRKRTRSGACFSADSASFSMSRWNSSGPASFHHPYSWPERVAGLYFSVSLRSPGSAWL